VSKTLILAEKPSVARDIAQALSVPLADPAPHENDQNENDQYVITSAIGHLVELATPEAYDPVWKSWSMGTLPMVQETFQLQPIRDSAAYLFGLKKLLARRDINLVINACDAGREGELIFRYIMRHAGCTKHVKRPWLSENTPSAVRTAFSRLRDGAEMANLGTAAELRSCADWLIGINATRAYTVRHSGFGNVLSVGRVQTPTLALLVQREQGIRGFQPLPYWQLVAQFSIRAGETYAGTWTRDDRDRFPTQAEAQRIQDALAGVNRATVARVEQKDKQ
jgi:DNA topoisomerase-3